MTAPEKLPNAAPAAPPAADAPQPDLRPRGTLPAFTPVPRLKERSDGWSPQVQRAFIEALADSGSVEAACRQVNRASVGAYLLRRHPEGASFRAAWEAALELGVQKIEDVAMERALNGVEVPVYSYGKLVGTRRVYNDRLLMFMLRNRAPTRFAAGAARGLNALETRKLERLKQEWHKEWEDARTQQDEDSREEIVESIKARIALMHEREDALMSPRTRELRAAFEQARKDDHESGYAHLLEYPGETEDGG